MKTKHIFLIIFTLTHVITASSQDLFANMKFFKTVYETNLELSSSKRGDKGYVANITQRYNDIIDHTYVFTSVSVYESKMYLFKQELNDVFDYYIKWSKVSKENNVQNVEKEIPVYTTSIEDLGCYAYAWNADKKDVKFIFKVENFKPYCIIKISLGFMDRRYYITEWYFSGNELMTFINEIQNVIQKQKEYDNKKQKTENLFQ